MLICVFNYVAVISDKPWQSPLGIAAAYEDIATSMQVKGHAFATACNCSEKAQQLRQSYKDGEIPLTEGGAATAKSAHHEKCWSFLTQLHTEMAEQAERESTAQVQGDVRSYVL